MITPSTEPHLSVSEVIFNLKNTANRNQVIKDTHGIFWSVLIGIVFGSLLAIGYVISH